MMDEVNSPAERSRRAMVHGCHTDEEGNHVETHVPATIGIVSMSNGRVGFDIWRKDTGQVYYVEVPEDEVSISSRYVVTGAGQGLPRLDAHRGHRRVGVHL